MAFAPKNVPREPFCSSRKNDEKGYFCEPIRFVCGLAAKAQVVAAYPITPQSSIVEMLANFCSSGQLQAKFINVESEHSAMAACISASVTGARTFTATSSQGLALMHELLHYASGLRLPIVMANVNRALGSPFNLKADLSDSLSQRDTGWLQFYCESGQEVFDTIIQSYRISEQILLPVMVNLEGFILSHTYEPVDIPDQGQIDRFLPPPAPRDCLDVENPCLFGGTTDFYINFRYKMHQEMERAKAFCHDCDSEFQKTFGRGYGLIQPYLCEDADMILVTAGTIAGSMPCRSRSIQKAWTKGWRFEGEVVPALPERIGLPGASTDKEGGCHRSGFLARMWRNLRTRNQVRPARDEGFLACL